MLAGVREYDAQPVRIGQCRKQGKQAFSGSGQAEVKRDSISGGLAAFAGRGSPRLTRLVVRIVSAARLAIGLEAKLLVLRVLDVEVRHLQFLQEPGSGFKGIPPRILEPVPDGIASLVMTDAARRDWIGRAGWVSRLGVPTCPSVLRGRFAGAGR